MQQHQHQQQNYSERKKVRKRQSALGKKDTNINFNNERKLRGFKSGVVDNRHRDAEIHA